MKKLVALTAALAGGLWLLKNAGKTTGPAAYPPGRKKELGTRALAAGASLLQGKFPLKAMNLYLDGFHFYADDMGRQMEAHHYCNQVNEDFIQCVVFDGNTRDARLIGVEYIVSERLFKTLPEEERKLWHSHHYEVSSGALIAPGVPEPVERKLMEKLAGTYGKVWQTWDTTRDSLPLGIPALMMAYTADGQAKPGLIEDRDERFHISSAERMESRRDIPRPLVVSGANSWETGRTCQLMLQEMEMSLEQAGRKIQEAGSD